METKNLPNGTLKKANLANGSLTNGGVAKVSEMSVGLSRDRLIEISDHVRYSNLHKKELIFKIVIVGDFGVGKTSIIQRYTEGEFSSTYKGTIGADFAVKTLEWDGDTRVNLHLWDIAGHERFGSLTGIFYRHATAAILVFDLTRPETFGSVTKWLKDLRRKVNLPGGRRIPTILLANKGDLTQTLPAGIEDFCQENGILGCIITSAKNNIQIDEAMLQITKCAMDNYLQCKIPLLAGTIILENDSEIEENKSSPTMTNKNSCCSLS